MNMQKLIAKKLMLENRVKSAVNELSDVRLVLDDHTITDELKEAMEKSAQALASLVTDLRNRVSAVECDIRDAKKQGEVLPKTASKQEIYIPRGHFYTLGMEETTAVRKVTDITKTECTTYGKVKIAKKTLDVYKTGNNEWTLA